jgi:GT2 family glycosyltransferase
MIAKNSKITVVLPIYADWSSLGQCLDSLLKYLDKRHDVVIINDCGPEADDLEKLIKNKIKDNHNFKYFRNSLNMGFVKTCNRAVFELDNSNNDIMLLNSDTIITDGAVEEMIRVLNVSDRHGAVSPRSSNATIASVPVKLANNEPERLTDYAYEVYTKVKEYLPEYTVVPVCVGFAMLIKRDLISNYGFLDEIYGLGYSEEVDFCMRINKFGYSSVLANRAFIYHLESRSFSSEKKKKLQAKNDELLLQRYPYYTRIVQDYFNYNINPVDWHADTLAGVRKQRKILISLYHLPLTVNGSVKNVLNFLEYAQDNNINDHEIVILAQKQAVEYHNLHKYGFRTVTAETIDELFDIGYSPLQIFHYEHLALLNRYCLRFAVSLLDIISLRNYDHYENDLTRDRIFYDSINFADKVFTISEYSKNDVIDYYNANSNFNFTDIKVITQGVPNDISIKIDLTKVDNLLQDFVSKNKEDFILLIGNHFPHKAIKKTLSSLKDYNKPLVVLGSKGVNKGNILFLGSGDLTDDSIAYLYSNAKAVLFPSTYEGYGLPIAEATYYSKPIILQNNPLSEEVAMLTKADATYFNKYDDLVGILDATKPNRNKHNNNVRTLNEYSKELFDEINKLITSNVDVDNLINRWYYFTSIEKYINYNKSNNKPLKNKIRDNSVKLLSKNKNIYLGTRKIYKTIRKNS